MPGDLANYIQQYQNTESNFLIKPDVKAKNFQYFQHTYFNKVPINYPAVKVAVYYSTNDVRSNVLTIYREHVL